MPFIISQFCKWCLVLINRCNNAHKIIFANSFFLFLAACIHFHCLLMIFCGSLSVCAVDLVDGAFQCV